MAGDPFFDLRVMVVDDQRAMRSIVRQLLNQIGITEISEATDGADALEKIRNPSAPPFDLVICDLHMATMDGMEFTNLVRRHKVSQLAGVPIIILTGDRDAFMHQVSEQAGATIVLTKPISAVDLKREISAIVGFGAG